MCYDKCLVFLTPLKFVKIVDVINQEILANMEENLVVNITVIIAMLTRLNKKKEKNLSRCKT